MCAGGKWSNRSFKTKENTAQLGEWGYFPCNCGQARSFAYIGGGRFQDDCGRSNLALKLWKSSIYSGVCVCVCVKHILPTSGTKKQQLKLENFVFLFALYLMIIDNTADSDLLRKTKQDSVECFGASTSQKMKHIRETRRRRNNDGWPSNHVVWWTHLAPIIPPFGVLLSVSFFRINR